MAVLDQSGGSLSDAYNLLRDLPEEAHQEFLLARESQTTESILGDDNQTVYQFYRFGEENDDILERMREHSSSVLENQVKSVVKNKNKELAKYSISNRKKDDSLLEHIDVGDINNFDRFSNLLETAPFEEVDFRPDQSPAFQTYRITQNGEVRFAALQKFTGRQVSAQTDGVQVAFTEEGDYELFDGAVVSFLNRIDCFYFDDSIFILNPSRFEDIFDYLHEYVSDADDVLTAIRDSNINISGFDKFVKSVRNDRRALRKMREIKKVGIYNNLSRKEIEMIVNDFDLSIDVEEGEGDEDWAIAIPDMRKKWDIIRLLNDDHLYSDLSKDRYQVYGKDSRS